MAKSILDIVIRTIKQGGADKEVISGLAGVKNALGQAGMLAGSFVAAYYAVDKALKATVGTFVDYAAQVRETSRLTGSSAEDSSRLIQMADDLTISYESLQKALWAASKNGINVSIESLAALADQYVAIQSPSERAEFLAKSFGKSGMEMGKMLEQGASGVRAASDAIKGNLVLTQAAVDRAREYEIATDALNDAWTSYKVGIGQDVIPALTDVIETTNLNIRHQEMLSEALETTNGNYRAANSLAYQMALAEKETARAAKEAALYIDLLGASLNATDEGAANYARTLQEIDYGDLLSTTLDLQNGFDNFAERAANIQERIAALDPASEDYTQTLAGLKNELNANAAAQELWAKKLVFSMAQAKLAVGGIDSGEFAFLIQLGVQMDLIDEKTAYMAGEINRWTDSLSSGLYGAEGATRSFIEGWKHLSALNTNKIFNIDVLIDLIVNETGGDGRCFIGSTPVSTPNGFSRIDTLQVGDLVCVKTADHEIVLAEVFKLHSSERDDLVTVRTSDDNEFTCSPNHRWQLENGDWKQANELSAGDFLNSDHGSVSVETVSPFPGRHKVFNLTVNHTDHTYMVGGLVVHNVKTERMLPPITSGSMMSGPANSMAPMSPISHTVSNSERVIHIHNLIVQKESDVNNVIDALS